MTFAEYLIHLFDKIISANSFVLEKYDESYEPLTRQVGGVIACLTCMGHKRLLNTCTKRVWHISAHVPIKEYFFSSDMHRT